MEPWGWILVYLVGFTLFQLLLFRYFSDGGFDAASLGSSEASASGSVERREAVRESPAGAGDDSDAGDAIDGVHCRQCGTVNADDQMYTYCRKCLTQLR
jgi:hypothetical protein